MDYLTRHGALYVCIAICFCVITYLGLGARQKEIVKQRLTRAQSKTIAATPPRTHTPEKERQDAESSKSPPYVKAFPPSQRAVLPVLIGSLTDAQRKALGSLSFDENKARTSLLGYEEDYRLAEDDRYSYAGFSMEEIKVLGDFPDYATLSGVPLPQPYNAFDYTKAVFRPYRPFRWAYHQTMC